MENDKKVTEEGLKKVIEALASNLDPWDFNETVLTGDWLITNIFGDYIREIEGWSCSHDKACFIYGRLKEANKLKKELPLKMTYRQYRDEGHKIRSDMTEEELDRICYWSPTSLEDTKQAREILLKLPPLGAKIIKGSLKNFSLMSEEDKQKFIKENGLDQD